MEPSPERNGLDWDGCEGVTLCAVSQMPPPTSVVVHPLVLLSTVDHYNRVAKARDPQHRLTPPHHSTIPRLLFRVQHARQGCDIVVIQRA